MYSSEQFLNDLTKIGNKEYTGLAAHSAEAPTDLFLSYRYQFILLLSSFKANDFENSRKISNSNAASLLDFIHNFNTSLLTNENPQPPFDFFLLVFMTTTSSGPNYSLFISLFQHYNSIKQFLSTYDGQNVFLNDRTRSSEISMSVSDAKTVIQSRIDYLAENIVSILYSTGQLQLLLTFLTDFCMNDFTLNEVTLSQLGRAALACGDNQIASSFFENVKDSNLISANQGYVNFYGNAFANAKKDFDASGSAGPANSDACLKFLGQFTSDPSDQSSISTKRQTAEDKTQWPMQPR
ncbi:hypothetical protein M9Y10_039354 [Tritrichomonas musculus]|uniref:Uncharacterized protein n=1 Tax=Tritrichomonas musculus TaxID=1915356 RepID=A0ABR2GKE8_9EUKA